MVQEPQTLDWLTKKPQDGLKPQMANIILDGTETLMPILE